MPIPPDRWEYQLQADDEGKKYADILRSRFHFSRRLLQHIKQGERAWVNGLPIYLSTRGKSGDLLALQLFDQEESNIPGENLPLNILYEDEYILAVSKPVGQVVHPTRRYPSGTVGNGVIAYWEGKGEHRPFRPVHRIDRNTSGLVVIAKNQFAHQQLAWQLERGLIEKVYIGIISGLLTNKEGSVSASLGLAPGSYIQRMVYTDGLPALTKYKVKEYYLTPKGSATLTEFIPCTGRTHQIRAHCQFLGHPLLGDDLYGGSQTLISRQALHSYSYTFRHPFTEKPLTLTAPLAEDMVALISTLKEIQLSQP